MNEDEEADSGVSPEDEEEIERRAANVEANRRAGKLIPNEALFPPKQLAG